MRPFEGSVFKTFLLQILTFLKRIFSGKIKFEANRETKMILGGSGGMLSRKNFKNLHTAMDILALFEQFVTQILFLILPLISPSPNILQFVRTFSIYAWLKVCLHLNLLSYEILSIF